jgi:hypothetical protein
MLSHHVEHDEAPIYHAMVPEQPSPWVMLEGHAIETIPPRPSPCKGPAPCNPIVETAGFSYTQTNKANNVKFSHHSLCNPTITSLVNAINARFLKEAPHLDAHSVQKHLFASPATSK